MGKFDTSTRGACVSAASDAVFSIRLCKSAYREKEDLAARAEEVRARDELIEIWQRLVQIERDERDACSVALQRATFEAEEARGEST